MFLAQLSLRWWQYGDFFPHTVIPSSFFGRWHLLEGWALPFSPFCLYVCCLFVYSHCGLAAAYSVGWYSVCHSIAQIDWDLASGNSFWQVSVFLGSTSVLSGTKKDVPASLILSLPLNQPLLQGALVHLKGQCYLKTMFWCWVFLLLLGFHCF